MNFDARLERLELKYLVDERIASRVIRDIEAFCSPDPNNRVHGVAGRGASRPGYPIASLYLDSPGLAFHEAKERGDATRMKLRVRTYAASSLAMLELKRRVSDVIDKLRVAVDRKDVERAAQGLLDALPESPAARQFLDDFARLVACSGAEPKLNVRYDREAYVSNIDHYARITFDRNIEARRADSWVLDPPEDGWCRFNQHWHRESDHRSVVLEIKCQSQVPWWVSELIRTHALQRQSFSKYSIGIHLTGVAMGENRTNERSARWMA